MTVKKKLHNFFSHLKKIDLSRVSLGVKTRVQAHTHVSTLILVIGAFVLVNSIFSLFPLRVDLSSGASYTLSSASKKIINNLDGTATLYVFASSDLPVRLIPLKTDISDLVREYDRVGGARVRVELLDPKKNEGAQKKAQEYGIPELQFSQIEQDKYAISSAYLGIAIVYKDVIETIPQAVNPQSLEYDISSALYKMTQKDPVKVRLALEGVGEEGRYEFAALEKLLSQQYEIQSVPIASVSSTLDTSISTLLISAAHTEFDDKSLGELQKYLFEGGAAIFMVDGVTISPELTAAPATHNLYSFFRNHGVELSKDLVLSENAEIANFSTSSGVFFAPYPFWVKTSNFTDTRPEFTNVQSLVYPWASSISDVNKDDTTILTRSSKNSWRQSEEFTLIPDAITPPSRGLLEQFNLTIEQKVGNGKFTLIPTSRFVKDQFLSPRANNMEFLLNLVNNYASGGALSGIRARSLSTSPLKNIDESSKDAIKYLSILLLPGLLTATAFIRLIRRHA